MPWQSESTVPDKLRWARICRPTLMAISSMRAKESLPTWTEPIRSEGEDYDEAVRPVPVGRHED